MAARRYEIFLPVLKNISLVRCAHSRNIFQHEKRNFVSPSGHVIFYLLYKHQWNTKSFMKSIERRNFCVTIATVIFSRVKLSRDHITKNDSKHSPPPIEHACACAFYGITRVWCHRIGKPQFSPVPHDPAPFLKMYTFECDRKHRIRVHGRQKRRKSPFSKISEYVWMGSKVPCSLSFR